MDNLLKHLAGARKALRQVHTAKTMSPFTSPEQQAFQCLYITDMDFVLIIEHELSVVTPRSDQGTLTNAERDRLTVAANKFRAELAALQECNRKLWTDPAKTRGSIVDKSPIDKAHQRQRITHL